VELSIDRIFLTSNDPKCVTIGIVTSRIGAYRLQLHYTAERRRNKYLNK
jgi:hypothetical protein